MIRHVAFEDLNTQHLDWIAESVLAQPEAVRANSADFLRAIKDEKIRLFDWEDGCILLGVTGTRLILYGFCCHNLLRRLPDLMTDVLRLAADWKCDAIETTCFDSRVTSAIRKTGARVESTTLVLDVE